MKFRKAVELVVACACFANVAGCVTVDEKAIKQAFAQTDFVMADTDRNGSLSREEMARYQHREALAEFDLDDDKKISSKEWTAINPDAGTNDDRFVKLDRNGDGKIAEDEALPFITSHAKFNEMFTALDTNKDNSLVWEEIAAKGSNSVDITLFSPESGAQSNP